MAETAEEDGTALKNKGNDAYSKGDYTEAVQLYTTAIEKEADNAAFYGNRAAAYMMLKKYEDAITDCKQAIELNPEYVKGYGRLAKALMLSGDCNSSIERYKEALKLEINPSLQKELATAQACAGYSDICRQMLDQKEYSKALAQSRLLLKEAPDALPFIYLHSEALTYSGKPEEAAQLLASAMRDPKLQNSSELLVLRARALFFIGQQQLQAAQAHLRQALEVDPDNGIARRLFQQIRQLDTAKQEGNAHFQAKRWAEAIASYTRCLEIEPLNQRINSVLYCNRAAALKEEGKHQEAVDDATAAINIDDKYVKAFLRRARCYQALENHDSAVHDLERAHQLDRSRETAQELREAKILQRRSKRKDFYKILGVSRDADERQIKKAYRELALKLHPDKMAGVSDEEKAKAEQHFKDIGEAYSVLSDPAKKRKYDNGVYDDGSGDGGFDNADASNLFNMFFSSGGPQVFFSTSGGGGRQRFAKPSGNGGTTFTFQM